MSHCRRYWKAKNGQSVRNNLKITLDVRWSDLCRALEDEGYLVLPKDIVQKHAESLLLHAENSDDKRESEVLEV